MQKVDELEKEGKYRDAWMKVPDLSEYHTVTVYFHFLQLMYSVFLKSHR
jgi:hypothetical protein